jgi:hypothetical protein
MSMNRLAIVACAIGFVSGSQAFAQTIVTTPSRGLAVTPERARGVELRRVSAQDTTHLAYEYQTGAGVARLNIDPASLVTDIDRARKRAPKKAAATPVAPALTAPVQEAAPRPEIAQASIVEPVVEAAPVARGDRKVRVIPLYNTPKLD